MSISLVNIGSGNGLLPQGTKSFITWSPGPVLTYHYDINIVFLFISIYGELQKKLINKNMNTVNIVKTHDFKVKWSTPMLHQCNQLFTLLIIYSAQ